MNRKATTMTVIAVLMGLGGGVAALSRVHAQHVREGTPCEGDHNHADEDQGQPDPHQHPGEETGDHEEEHQEPQTADAHDHDEHAGHDDHGDESAIRLSAEDRTRFGLEVAIAGAGNLATRISLPGEIVLNDDRVAHIVPRAPGIVREVLAHVGDTLRAGQILAWLESSELGEAKVDYLAKWTELGCCTMDLVRAQEVHDNTVRLLEVLKSSPSMETLREMNGSAMGENRSILVSAYAEFVFAKAAYLRERPLFEKKVASERDVQAAEAEYQKADALYAATRDSVDFKVRRDLLEAQQAQRVREIELKGATRRLYVLGLTSEEIKELEVLAQLEVGAAEDKPPCSDPNCQNCKQAAANLAARTAAALQQAEQKLAWYPLRAPFDATVIEKHLTLGEKHGDDSDAFTIADLTSVWVDLAVYQKDLAYVKEGMAVSISAGASMPSADGVVAYLAPVVDKETRTALARVVLPNPDGEWRPGLFVSAEIAVGEENASVVVPRSSIQRMDEESVVFVDTNEGFKAVPVALGRSSAGLVEVISGLNAGQRYVAQGAFELKAKIVTSGLDPHAGHGH